VYIYTFVVSYVSKPMSANEMTHAPGPENVQYFHCNLTSPDSIKSAADSVKSKLGNPTVLVNNAGVAHGKTILATTPRDLTLTFNVNALSHYHLVQQFLPHMIEKNHGMIVTVASTAAYVTAPSMVDYASSKAAALSFHEGLSAELATTYNAPKVRTVVICQSYTRTSLFKGFDQGDPFINYPLYPETVAEEIVKSILAGRSRHVNMPGTGRYVGMGVRGWSEWMQYGLRKRCVNLMKGWDGRQVKQNDDKTS
jgi:short-subunit dehydrogenase